MDRPEENPDAERKRYVRRLFDSIVPTYDFLNRILSMRIDTLWRRYLVRLMGREPGRTALDACCGTGDLSRLIARSGSGVVSLDFSLPMILAGRRRGWLGPLVVAADASMMPFTDGSFTHVTIAFGIRNIPDREVFMSESLRVLKEGGRLLILELTRPGNRVIAGVYRFYLMKFVPFVGGLISGKRSAYQYLADTISGFTEPAELRRLLIGAGFSRVELHPRTFGVATIFECVK